MDDQSIPNSRGRRGYNLPAQSTPLIDRQREVQVVCARLRDPDVRLLTLTGAPGIGKTRIAIAAAPRLARNFEHGVYFVDMAGVADPAQITAAIMCALGLKEAGDRPSPDALPAYLEDKQVLLLLDSFEHVLHAATQLADLLSTCPDLKLLVTSREALRLRWEQVFPVLPLPVPDVHNLPELVRLQHFPSVRLFVNRAQALQPEFALNQRNAAQVAEICARLDGIPLAIELVAGHIDILAPGDIVEKLRYQELDLFEGGPDDLPKRQQTLRKAVGWSYDLLAPEEQQLMRRLAIFVGGGSIDAAQSICGTAGLAPLDVPTTMTSLVRKSLLRFEEIDGERRFSLLDMIRRYGREQLAATEELEGTGHRHATYYLEMAEDAEPHLVTDQLDHWFLRLTREHDNLWAALRWFDGRGDVEHGLQLAGALWRFWRACAYYSEGRRQIEALLEGAGGLVSGAVHARALTGAGELARYIGDYAESRKYHERALALYRDMENRQGIAFVLVHLAAALRYVGDFRASRAALEESLALFRETGDQAGIGQALTGFAEMSLIDGDYSSARLLGEEALVVRGSQADKWGVAVVLNIVGGASFLLQDYKAAHLSFAESLRLAAELGDLFRIAFVLESLACLAAAQGQQVRALRLEGGASRWRRVAMAPSPPPFRAMFEQLMRQARQGLSAEAIAAALHEGCEMDLEQAIEYALSDGADTAQPAPRGARMRQTSEALSPEALSLREREVAALIALGLSNSEIAAKLVISRRTVEAHAAHILGKLGLSSRAQLVAWAAKQGRLLSDTV